MQKSRFDVLLVVEKTAPRSEKVIKEQTKLSLRTVKYSLKDLQAEGLVEKKDGCWQRTAVTVEEVAERRGLKGYSENLKREYERQSREYVEVVRDEGRGRKLNGRLRIRTHGEPPQPEWSDVGEGEERKLVLTSESDEAGRQHNDGKEEYEHRLSVSRKLGKEWGEVEAAPARPFRDLPEGQGATGDAGQDHRTPSGNFVSSGSPRVDKERSRKWPTAA
jgi:hypothetical protein